MFVTYTPEDGDRQEWVWDPTRIRATEAQVMLREFGTPSWDLFEKCIKMNDPNARRVLLWHLIRRDHPMMKFADTPDFFLDEMTVELSSTELARMIDEARNSGASPDQKAAAIASFEKELEEANRREAAVEGIAGKEMTPTSGTESTTTG